MKKRIQGFTLIEMLLVIAIIGVLAGVLLVTINPIEQINKANDSGKLARCKDVIGGAERYWTLLQADPANCAALITSGELKAGGCNGVILVPGVGGSYTCTFVPVSGAFKLKCNFSVTKPNCIVPDDFD